MIDPNLFISIDIEKTIQTYFPQVKVAIFYEPEGDCYFVAIDDTDVYYSDQYQELVMDIKMNILWKKNINNYFFILDHDSCCGKSIEDISSTQTRKEGFVFWSVSEEIVKFEQISSFFPLDKELVA
ncbi:MAG TPA: hypothetical protein PLW34_03470 [Termitinemataceae bacterium]|nr:hypothetical protein [Termitinemataceae bacterium]HOM23838.1 hypothetical protein [Termitinemataceae bacterium]HPP99898.1 hypothetical protein [Termitinemataceae bacterium]